MHSATKLVKYVKYIFCRLVDELTHFRELQKPNKLDRTLGLDRSIFIIMLYLLPIDNSHHLAISFELKVPGPHHPQICSPVDRWGHTRMSSQPSSFLTILCISQGVTQCQDCPLLNVVFAPLSLPASLSSSLYGAL